MDSLNFLVGIDQSNIDFSRCDIPLHNEVVGAYLELCGQARAAGFGLKAASGYRDFERQLVIWNAKALGHIPLLDIEENILDIESLSDDEKLWAILRWTALPGTSRHHWGTDFDIYDAAALGQDETLALTVDETLEGGPFYPMYQWLDNWLENQSLFFRPYCEDKGGVAPEPWHLSYLPLARKYASQFEPSKLKGILAESDIELKALVLDNLDEIIERFVLLDGS